jgi:hypothetical protein
VNDCVVCTSSFLIPYGTNVVQLESGESPLSLIYRLTRESREWAWDEQPVNRDMIYKGRLKESQTSQCSSLRTHRTHPLNPSRRPRSARRLQLGLQRHPFLPHYPRSTTSPSLPHAPPSSPQDERAFQLPRLELMTGGMNRQCL